jgi:hypothetical protein
VELAVKAAMTAVGTRNPAVAVVLRWPELDNQHHAEEEEAAVWLLRKESARWRKRVKGGGSDQRSLKGITVERSGGPA